MAYTITVWSRGLLAICLSLFIGSLVIFGYVCQDQTGCVFGQNWARRSHHFRTHRPPPPPTLTTAAPTTTLIKTNLSFEDMQREPSFTFDIKGSDVIVFLHIQKTGGTSFGKHLVRDLDLEYPCECKKGRKRCKCVRPDESGGGSGKLWLFSRYSTGWKCGLHADWTELTNCVDSVISENENAITPTVPRRRRYFYITLLREPVGRFLSEFRHVQRGATWKNSRHWCDGRTATVDELRPCYNESDWSDVTLDEFMSCPDNLAFNRQTRMLADLSLVACYNRSAMAEQERNARLLASAKENLRKMAFFGLCEFQKYSQYLFESTFKLNFLRPFIQLNETHSTLALSEIDAYSLQRIRQLNSLDIELYQYAKQLLIDRFEAIKAADANFEANYNRLAGMPVDDEDAPEARLIRKMKILTQKSRMTTTSDAYKEELLSDF